MKEAALLSRIERETEEGGYTYRTKMLGVCTYHCRRTPEAVGPRGPPHESSGKFQEADAYGAAATPYRGEEARRSLPGRMGPEAAQDARAARSREQKYVEEPLSAGHASTAGHVGECQGGNQSATARAVGGRGAEARQRLLSSRLSTSRSASFRQDEHISTRKVSRKTCRRMTSTTRRMRDILSRILPWMPIRMMSRTGTRVTCRHPTKTMQSP